MNAKRLLAHYERIADAPDAVTRLRRFVLDLAVRGKLVPQDPTDEPASELLKRIAKAKVRRLEAGEVGKPRSAEPVNPAEVLFSLPETWAWVRVGEIFEYDAGIKREPRELIQDRWLLELEDIEKDTSLILERRRVKDRNSQSTKSEFEIGDILYGKLRPYLNKVVVANEPGYSTTEIVAVRPFLKLCAEYCALAFRRPDFVAYVERLGRGTKMPRLRTPDAIAALFPLPPVAEQHRIVATVNEMMALCDQLEVSRAERDATRDKLTAASLARLNAPDPETFRDDAHFALEALPALTARPDQIKQLRQTILNLAVRGKLVPQEPKDEPASELLRRIPALPKPARYEKRSPELIAGDCGLSINHPNTGLPRGWRWVPLIEIARLESGHTPSRNRPEWWGGDVPWIGLVDARLHNNGTIFNTIQTTNEEGLANSAARLLPAGTVCFSRTASVGYVVIMGRPMATSQDFVNWVPSDAISSSWLQLVMIAERPAIGRFSKGAVHQTIYYPAWLSMHIVLPPLEEQRRIVVKVGEMMALCDHLETSLATIDGTRRQLLEALLAEALAPDNERELEAAE